jgi:hypothetical protein
VVNTGYKLEYIILQVTFQIGSDDNYFISLMKKEMYDTIDGKVLRCF